MSVLAQHTSLKLLLVLAVVLLGIIAVIAGGLEPSTPHGIVLGAGGHVAKGGGILWH